MSKDKFLGMIITILTIVLIISFGYVIHVKEDSEVKSKESFKHGVRFGQKNQFIEELNRIKSYSLTYKDAFNTIKNIKIDEEYYYLKEIQDKYLVELAKKIY